MEILKNRIINDGIVVPPNILRVDSFLNHQIDVALYEQIGAEFANRFGSVQIDRIATVETGGVALACFVSQAMGHVPVVYAKKDSSAILSDDCYSADIHSFTKKRDYVIRLDRRYLKNNENVLVIDDFLANGQACLGLAGIIEQAGARVAGFGIVIEKGFQPGRKLLEENGYQVQSLAIIEKLEDGKVVFRS